MFPIFQVKFGGSFVAVKGNETDDFVIPRVDPNPTASSRVNSVGTIIEPAVPTGAVDKKIDALKEPALSPVKPETTAKKSENKKPARVAIVVTGPIREV